VYGSSSKSVILITEGNSNISGGLAGKTAFILDPVSLKNKKRYRYMHLTLTYILQNGTVREAVGLVVRSRS
jgi:hypothetical protein